MRVPYSVGIHGGGMCALLLVRTERVCSSYGVRIQANCTTCAVAEKDERQSRVGEIHTRPYCAKLICRNREYILLKGVGIGCCFVKQHLCFVKQTWCLICEGYDSTHTKFRTANFTGYPTIRMTKNVTIGRKLTKNVTIGRKLTKNVTIRNN